MFSSLDGGMGMELDERSVDEGSSLTGERDLSVDIDNKGFLSQGKMAFQSSRRKMSLGMKEFKSFDVTTFLICDRHKTRQPTEA